MKHQQAESHEPVAWIVPVQTLGGDISQKLSWTKSGAGISGVLFEPSERFPLYKSPQKHAWVGLTEQEVKDIFDMDLGVYESIEETMRRLKEKNKCQSSATKSNATNVVTSLRVPTATTLFGVSARVVQLMVVRHT